jgi:protein CpxP
MSFKNKISTAMTMAVAVVAFGTFASAQDNTAAPSQDGVQKQEKRDGRWGRRGMKRGEGRKDFGRHGGFGLRGIELTDAQKQQIQSIRAANKPDEATMQEMRSIREARKAGGTLTDAQKDRIKALHEQNRVKREAVQQQILSILTPEQRSQLEARKAERQKRMEERKQERKERREKRKAESTTTPTGN